jgi:hypothetical protein
MSASPAARLTACSNSRNAGYVFFLNYKPKYFTKFYHAILNLTEIGAV